MASQNIYPASLLPHDSTNPTGKSTILFVHGAFSSRLDWDLVIPYLQVEYHILLPDLPGHGEAKNFSISSSSNSVTKKHHLFSVTDSAKLLATLIEEKAHNSVAHVVGLSLGAHVALKLATLYPNRVSALVISGFEVFPPSNAWLSYCAPYVLWSMEHVESLLPRRWVRYAMDGADIRAVDSYICTLDLCKAIAAPMMEDVEPDNGSLGTAESPDSNQSQHRSEDQHDNKSSKDRKKGSAAWPKTGWPAPTLVIAAGKKSFLIPSADHPNDTRRVAEIGKSGNAQTCAVTHPAMRHPWNRQDPKLFADTVRAWIEHCDVLETRGFVKL